MSCHPWLVTVTGIACRIERLARRVRTVLFYGSIMPIEITLERRHIPLTPPEAALAKAATSRQALRPQFERAVALKPAVFQPAGSLTVDEATLRWCIHRYSEQLVPDAVEQVNFFLSLHRPVYPEPGFAPLYYFAQKSGGQGLSVNKSAVAAIGEGVGALVLQRLMQARIISRPYHDFPDLIGTDAVSGSQITTSKIYLLEAKSTCMRSVAEMRQTLMAEVFRLAAYTAAAQDLDPARVMVGVLVGVVIHSVDRFHALLTEVTL